MAFRPATQAAVAAGFFVAYVALEWLSFIHEEDTLPVTPWNPGLGAVFALMMISRPMGALVLFAGVVAAEVSVLQSTLTWSSIFALGALLSLSYVSVAALARRVWRLDVQLVHLRDVLLLLGTGAAGACIACLLLTTFFVVTGQLPLADAPRAAVPLLVGDVIGISVTTPLLLRFVFRRRHLARERAAALAPEIFIYVLAIGAALWTITWGGAARGPTLFYLLFIPIVVAAVRHGLDGACLSLSAAQIGLVAVLYWQGSDAEAFTQYQTLMTVLTVTGLIVGVAVSERRNSLRLARQAQARLRDKESEAAQAARFNLVTGMASALSHEIMQPMTAARAHARTAQHILQSPTPDLDRAAANLADMIAQIDHAGGVVHRMRDFLRRGQPHVSTLDTPALLAEAMMLMRADASARRVRLDLEIDQPLPSVHGDRVQITQVILNLARNAFEALADVGRKDACVRIIASAQMENDRAVGVTVAVIDNGPGIDAARAETLFTPLSTSKDDGLGLGLAICAAIIEAHGGRIELHSGTPGATEFRFTLPASKAT